MTYDFDQIVPRRGTGSYKWDSAADADVLPLWVADMDFRTAPAVTAALQQRVAQGIFGYTQVTDAYYDAVIRWMGRRHGWTLKREWIIYTSGVVPALSAIIKAQTLPGDKVLVQTPVYNCFYSSIRNNGCQVASSPLRLEADGTWHMDFDDLERQTADPRTRVMLLCNPHNPVGRVWTRPELERVADICLRHGVTVVADEIHGELTYEGHPYIPYATVVGPEAQAQTITCTAASKAFNLAGLQLANIVAPNPALRERIDRAININEVCDVNPFGIVATTAAYDKGEEWLDQLRAYLWGNYLYMKDYCQTHLADFPIAPLEGTYLVWMDCRRLDADSERLEQRLLREAKLWLNAGAMYGPEGEGYMRWNIACPRSVLADALARFTRFVQDNRHPSHSPTTTNQ